VSDIPEPISTDQLYERLLVLRCQTASAQQAGDERAFAELIGRYHARLLFYLRRLLPTGSDVEAAVQDVWLSVHRQLAGLREIAAFRTWLYRIARDRAGVELRRKRIPLEPLQAEEIVGAEEPEFAPEDAQHVHAALDQLSREQREVLVLRFLEGMSYDEIAGVVGCQVGTIRSRLHYAKQTLRTILEQDICHE
jgi:RNA polymerase sigma-70 factor, ECF subfamily